MKRYVSEEREVGEYVVEAGVDEIDAGGFISVTLGGTKHNVYLSEHDRRWLIQALYHVGDDDYYEDAINEACRQAGRKNTRYYVMNIEREDESDGI